MIGATFATSVVAYGMVRLLGISFENQNMLMVLLPLILIAVVSGVVYIAASAALRIKDVEAILAGIKKIILPKPRVQPPTE